LDANVIFLAIALSIFIGFAANYLFRKYGAPDVLFLILLGLLFGPGALGLVDASLERSIASLAPYVGGIALAIIMFEAGMDLKARQVLGAFKPAVLHSLLAFFLSMAIVATVATLFMSWDLSVATTLGAILASTSGAILIPLVRRLDMSEKTKIVLTLEAAISEALAIVVVVTLLTVIRDGALDLGAAFRLVGGAFLLSAVLGLATGVFWLFVLNRMSGQPFAYMITMATVLAVYAGADLLASGSGGVIAALLFGLVLGNHHEVARILRRRRNHFSYDDRVKDFNTEVSFFVRTFFFVYLGIVSSLIAFDVRIIVFAVVIFLALILVRYVTTLLERRQMKLERMEAAAHAAIMPRGLVAAVLASLPLSFGVVSNEIGSLILGTTVLVIIMSTAMASIGTYVIHKRFGGKKAKGPRFQEMNGLGAED
jgi:cell volume regulation protein A